MTFIEWQAKYSRMRGIAERIDRMRRDRACQLAATVGIPDCGCCLHNASIDDNLSGWCYRNPAMLKVAKHARRIADSAFDGYRILDRWHDRVRIPTR